jgi:UDP-N-acetylglucosamine--N-acetylmuramyl-(pentapeptide) pyrophosphoryl-undecaprenol N-acetylglucosamine transferase
MLTVDDARRHLNAKGKIILTGLPVRGELCAQTGKRAGLNSGLTSDRLVLSMGGSLGARAINEAVTQLITALHQKQQCQFLHAYGQYGRSMPERLREKRCGFGRRKTQLY